MLFSKQNIEGKSEFMADVEKAQIELINSNRVFSIGSMALGAILLYVFLAPQVKTPVFSIWLAVILLVDAFRMYVTWSYHQAKKDDRVNHVIAKWHIIIGTILSGLCWGGLGVILLPVVDDQSKLVVMLGLVVVATASTTTLSYMYRVAVVFVLLVLAPLMFYWPKQEEIADANLLALELIILMLFLLKNARVFYERNERILYLQVQSLEREHELAIQREKADIANQAKSNFLTNISHELRTPMHAILGYSSLGATKTGSASDEKILNYFSRINESGQRLLGMLNDLLDLSKLEAGRMNLEMTRNDLQATLHSVAEELAPLLEDRSLTLKITSPAVDTVAIYDKEKIAQVIRNLLSNAIKFSPNKMIILVKFEEANLAMDNNPLTDESVAGISLSIQNQGPSIPEDELETVFEKFMQSSKAVHAGSGTGLGLSISKEIIERHHGVIKASNCVNGGSAFTFILPRQQMTDTDSHS